MVIRESVTYIEMEIGVFRGVFAILSSLVLLAGLIWQRPCAAAPPGAIKGPQNNTARNAGATEIGVILKQHFGYVDRFTAYVTPEAVRVDSDNHDYFLISRAPDWQVYLCKPNTREISIISHHDWCHKYLSHQMSWTAGLNKPTGAVKQVKDGQHLIHYNFGSTEIIGATLPMRTDQKVQPRRFKPNHAEIICLDYPGAAMTGPVIARIRGLPPVAGLVLSAIRYELNNPTEGAIFTDKETDNVPIERKIFIPPNNYKTVPFALSMLQTAATNENTQSLLQDLMSP